MTVILMQNNPKHGGDERSESSNQSPPPPAPLHGKPNFSDPVTDEEYGRLNDRAGDLRTAADNLTNDKSLSAFRAPKSGSERAWMKYAGLGLQMAAAITLPVLGGLYADSHWGWEPWGVLAGALLGTSAGMYSVIATVSRDEKRDANNPANSKPKPTTAKPTQGTNP